jgi:hypothetical protein
MPKGTELQLPTYILEQLENNMMLKTVATGDFFILPAVEDYGADDWVLQERPEKARVVNKCSGVILCNCEQRFVPTIL